MKLNDLNRRRFLLTTAAATTAACAWEPLLSTCRAAGAPHSPLRSLDLSGPWQVSATGKNEWIPARVPGCVHTDLLAAGKIPDPYFRDNEDKLQWIGETDWAYRRSFQLPPELHRQERIVLRCEGLDTLATVTINGQEIGRADNMFRTWEFDAKPALKAGENLIEVRFASPFPVMKERNDKRPMYEWIGSHEPKGRAWVRKQPCNFGWDWGPVLVTCGIWRGISLETFDPARLADVLILQDHSPKGQVTLDIEVVARGAVNAPLRASVVVTEKQHKVAAAKVDLLEGKGRISVPIKHPKLWWPVGLGDQPLYEVRVELLDARNEILDQSTRRIGLRSLKMLPPDEENPLRFEANGVLFFAKGANWIPADAFANRVTPEILRRYVADAVAVNMNSLRFWGGGYYEDDALFDACDEMGICVWMDFKFACSAYPSFDDAFLENVQLEARDQLRRLRHHACIAVWCGNNEIGLMTKDEWSEKSMGRADYDKLFKHLLGQQVQELAPQANYVSGSPDCGDTHYWDVWHGGKTFDAYRKLNGFMSEFGFQSFPHPETVQAYTAPEDRASVVTPVMNWHQRSPKGNEKIRDMTEKYFRPPKDFESALWLSQILQGYGIKTGAEYWRQNMPKSMGCVFWQYNDCWPVASWSSVDYFGRWKALHYLARRFYAPILVSGLEDEKTGKIEVFITSDRLQAARGTLTCTVTGPEGKILSQQSLKPEIPAQESRKVLTLDLQEQVRQHGAEALLAWLKLEVDGATVSENLVTLVPPKQLKLADPGISCGVTRTRDGFLVALKAAKPALWAWLNLQGMDARYSDNFVHLAPNSPVKISVQPSRPVSEAEFKKLLRVRSIYDT